MPGLSMTHIITLLLMLMGNATVVTTVSTLILSFIYVDGSETLTWRIVLLIDGLVVLWSVPLLLKCQTVPQITETCVLPMGTIARME